MARVKPIEGRRSPLMLRLLNVASRYVFGKETLPLKILAHNPKFLLPYASMSRFSQGKIQLPDEIRHLAMYLVAFRNGCSWCLDFARFRAQKREGLADKLVSIDTYATNPLFTPAERAALRYADEMTEVGGRVSDATFEELRRYFSEREIVELTVAAATENFYNRINAALEIEAQGFCALPVPERAAQAG